MSGLTYLIAEINRGGFLVASLYQVAPQEWVCCLRPKGKFSTIHGRASTLKGALRDAWTKKCHESLFDSWDYTVEDGELVKKGQRRAAAAARKRIRGRGR